MKMEAPDALEGSPRIRIAFVVTGLTIGGAEMMLWKLLSRIDRARFEPVVIALSGGVDPGLRERFDWIGVECHTLGMHPALGAVSGLFRLRKLLRAVRPHLVQGWMYHGNVAATFATRLLRPEVPVLWNIRGTLLANQKPLSTFIIWLGGRLSGSPARIINNSRVSALEHERRFGYDPAKRVLLPNGFDTQLFKPSAAARVALRRSLAIPESAVLVGLFGRYHRMKDHAGFLAAAARVRQAHPEVHFVLAGEYVDASNGELSRLVEEHALGPFVHLLGLRSDIERLTPALDVAVSSSAYGEGFPNVIGEAMSCGVPCVATDVGDSAWVVGDTGRIVPPRAGDALAAAIAELVAAGRETRTALGVRARERVVECFALDAVARQYEALYTTVHRESAGLRGRVGERA